MRRKVSTANWRFPLRMSRTQWARLPYRDRHAIIAQAMCTLLGHWRDCSKRRCRGARRCLFPHPCYWNRKQQMSEAEQAQARKLYEPLLKLTAIGSSQGSDGLWLF
jgi:hypothetical protein